MGKKAQQKRRARREAAAAFARSAAAQRPLDMPSGHIRVDGEPMAYWLPAGAQVDVAEVTP